MALAILLVHPRRYAWLMDAISTTGYPFMPPRPVYSGSFANVAQENIVGELAGLKVLIDANLPVTSSGSGNADYAVLLRSSDLTLYRGQVQTQGSRRLMLLTFRLA